MLGKETNALSLYLCSKVLRECFPNTYICTDTLILKGTGELQFKVTEKQ